jgi:hypothetical protein
MPTFASAFPIAYHAIPLHLAKPIWILGELLSRTEREKAGMDVGRRSSRAYDRALGFGGHVHLYLHREGATPAELPIVEGKLGATNAIPHVVLEIPTSTLGRDADLVVCAWNVPKALPKTKSNPTALFATDHTPERTAAIWDELRAMRPSAVSPADRKELRGKWVEGFKPPVMTGPAINQEIMLSAYGGKKRTPLELLIPKRLKITDAMTVHVFSDDDAEMLERLGAPVGGASVKRAAAPGYAGRASARAGVYEEIERYFDAPGFLAMPGIDFDRAAK